MDRTDLLNKLARYRPIDESDDAQRRAAQDFVHREPDCFARSCPVGHVTGSAWLLDSTGRRVLLTLHRKLGKWIQLGGHCDGDADVLAVAIREAQEESGIVEIRAINEEIFDLDVHLNPAAAGESGHLHYDIRFLLQVTGGGAFAVSDESHALAWFTADELRNLELDASVQRMCRKWERLMAGGTASGG